MYSQQILAQGAERDEERAFRCEDAQYAECGDHLGA